MAAIAFEQLVRSGGAGASGGVIGEVFGLLGRPGLQDGIDQRPARLNGVGPLEKRRIADEAVIDQGLVADARRGGKEKARDGFPPRAAFSDPANWA